MRVILIASLLAGCGGSVDSDAGPDAPISTSPDARVDRDAIAGRDAGPIIPGAWRPPIGIPLPSWPTPIDLARPDAPASWTSELAPYYFVSSTACDDSRDRGTPTAPRCSLPDDPPAGSIVFLDGTISGEATLRYRGTAQSPIWVLGFHTATPPSVTDYWDIPGSYVIVDGVHFDLSTQDGINLIGDHILVRYTSSANPFGDANGSGFGIGGTDIVFYRNRITQMGDWLRDGEDIDRQGIKVEGGARDVWIVDNEIFHCQSDAVQVGDQNNTPAEVQRIFVGRNLAYENLQFGFWTKNATDVIFSENIVHSHNRSTVSGPGGGLGGQYDPQFVWFIANQVHDSRSGIHIAGTSDGGGGPWFALGNVLYAIGARDSCNGYDAGALGYRNDGGFFAHFNTVHDADFFLGLAPSGGEVSITNNIVSSMRRDCTSFVTERSFEHDYNLYSSVGSDDPDEAHRIVAEPGFDPSTLSIAMFSPAIDAASPSEAAAYATFMTRYGIDIRRDLHGAMRPLGAAWDIGAIEAR